MSIKKQLSRWREDWMRFWGKTSLMMRIVIGAATSTFIAISVLRSWNKPLSKEVAELQKKLDEAVLDNSFNLQMAELKVKRERGEAQVEEWKRRMKALAEGGLNCEEAGCGMVLAAIRRSMEDSGLMLRQELAVIPQKEDKSRTSRTRTATQPKVDEWKSSTTYPAFMGRKDYHYRISGSFTGIMDFLNALPKAEKAFNLNNISISSSGPAPGVLILDFDLAIPVSSAGIQVTAKAEPKSETKTAAAKPSAKKR